MADYADSCDWLARHSTGPDRHLSHEDPNDSPTKRKTALAFLSQEYMTD